MYTDEQYINKVGLEGAFRLHVLNDVHGPYSRRFLKDSGLKTGMSVLDIGCGTGTMSCWIASQIGRDGKVYAADFSKEQLDLAERNAKLKGIDNIEFLQLSVYDLNKITMRFDMVYCRYFLLHLKNIDYALSIIKNKIKKDGIIACEEPTISTAFCYPQSAAYKKSRELISKLAETKKLDFEIGLKLKQKLIGMGFSNIDVSLVQPILKNSHEKKLIKLILEEYAPHCIKNNLSSFSEVTAVINDLNELIVNDNFFIGLPRTTQIYAKNPQQ